MVALRFSKSNPTRLSSSLDNFEEVLSDFDLLKKNFIDVYQLRNFNLSCSQLINLWHSDHDCAKRKNNTTAPIPSKIIGDSIYKELPIL